MPRSSGAAISFLAFPQPSHLQGSCRVLNLNGSGRTRIETWHGPSLPSAVPAGNPDWPTARPSPIRCGRGPPECPPPSAGQPPPSPTMSDRAISAVPTVALEFLKLPISRCVSMKYVAVRADRGVKIFSPCHKSPAGVVYYRRRGQFRHRGRDAERKSRWGCASGGADVGPGLRG
jgi:hypothetical protein